MKTSTQLRAELHDVRVDLCSYDGKVTVTADNGDVVEIKGATPEQLLKAADRLVATIRWSAKERDADLWIDRLSDLQAEVERTMGALRDKIEKKAKETAAA